MDTQAMTLGGKATPEQIQKRRDVLKDAKLLVKNGFKCPSDIADMCDDDGLIKYKESE